jgi:hypothetical protein
MLKINFLSRCKPIQRSTDVVDVLVAPLPLLAWCINTIEADIAMPVQAFLMYCLKEQFGRKMVR